MIKLFSEFLNESDFRNKINSQSYWEKVLAGNEYALKVLKTVMEKQGGFASDRQMEIFNKVKNGDKSSYSSKN